jgi:TolA-binding protein
MIDRLDQATQALKEHEASLPKEAADEARVSQTRAAILAAAKPRAVSKVVPFRSAHAARRWILPIAATFFLLGSLAAARTAWNRYTRSALDAKQSEVSTVPSAAGPSVVASAKPADSNEANAPVTEPASPASTAVALRMGLPAAEPSHAAADSLYYKAHALHFDTHDYASALPAWDAYLKTAPTGHLAPEARYNRAMALLHLGRKNEAEIALKPFANGTYGTYRRREAEALLEQLAAP